MFSEFPLINYLKRSHWAGVEYVSVPLADGEDTWLNQMKPRVVHLVKGHLPDPYTDANVVFSKNYKMRDPDDPDYVVPLDCTIITTTA